MKKIIACFCGLVFCSIAICQETVKFSMGLSPNKTYHQILDQKTTVEFNLDSSMSHSGDSKFPTKKEQEMHLESATTTGALSHQTNKMPVTLTIISGDSNTVKFLKPGTRFMGNAGMNELPVYDSISGTTMDKKQKILMMKVLSNLSKISMPSKNLKPGDNDTVRTVFDNPIGGGGQMDFVTIFHLKSIQGSTAFFDIQIEIRFNLTAQNISVPGNGTGDGSLDYDLKSHYPSKYNLNYQINMTFPDKGKSSGMKMSTSMQSTYKISS